LKWEIFVRQQNLQNSCYLFSNKNMSILDKAMCLIVLMKLMKSNKESCSNS